MTTMLHTVNKSPFEKNSVETCLRLSSDGSHILFIEDGVYAAIKGSAYSAMVSDGMATRKIHVLGPDLQARGIAEQDLIDGIEIVDYDGFVRLAAESSKIQSWL